jgi:response regulator RpfG family c-di-GMP phosphodiesterase
MLQQGSIPTLTVVEDESVTRELLVRTARSWQYECQAAGTSEEGLELLHIRATPIVVIDVHLAGRGGVWLVREVRRRWPEVAVVVLTGRDDPEPALECLRAGVAQFFFKPVQPADFRQALESTWRTCQARQEHACYRQYLERTLCRETRRVRLTFLSAVDSLVRTLEERDPCTAGHSRRVRRYALRLANAVGLERRERRRLLLAAKLHDIGKIGVPEAILNKPAALTPQEQDVVSRHPVIGERILRPIVRSRAVLAAVRGHHERLDGKGYPDGLKGSHIPLLARLLAVADCFDALTSARAYRQALPVPDALDVMRAGAGNQFEPEFVRALVEVSGSLLTEAGGRPR